MEPFLTVAEIGEYKKLHKQYKSSGKADPDRIKAILMLSNGYDYEQISMALLIDDDTARRWHKQYKAIGLSGLLQEHYAGGEPRLTIATQQNLSEYLENNICLTAKEVCNYVEQEYGVVYTFKGMTSLLHRMDFTYKKPKHLPSKANRAAQENFIKEYESLKKNKNPEDQIYFVDGTHPLHNSQLGYGWFKKGKDKFIKANTGRQRVNINGAYNIATHHAIVREDASINAQSTIALVEQMMKEHPAGMLYLILDNATYYHAQLIKDFLLKNERIKFVYLPPYSPNLNLIERLWKFFKKKITYCKYYEKFSVFRQKIWEFFENIKNYRGELEKLMTENFQLFPA